MGRGETTEPRLSDASGVCSAYALPILISTITGSLSIAGSEVGTLSTGDLGNLQGRGTKQLALPLTLSFLSAGNAVMTAINGGNANLAFDARLVSGADQVPLKVDQWVNFVR